MDYKTKHQMQHELESSRRLIEEYKIRLNSTLRALNEEQVKNGNLQKAYNEKVAIIKLLLDRKWYQFWK
jgi:hypothetical protein